MPRGPKNRRDQPDEKDHPSHGQHGKKREDVDRQVHESSHTEIISCRHRTGRKRLAAENAIPIREFRKRSTLGTPSNLRDKLYAAVHAELIRRINLLMALRTLHLTRTAPNG
jgi:hypothetical protein